MKRVLAHTQQWKILLVAIASLVLFPFTEVLAAPVYGTNTNIQLSGSRTAASGNIVTSPTVATEWDDISISWTITQNGSLWNYSYSFSDPSPTKDISFFILDITDNCISGNSLADSNCVTNSSDSSTLFGNFNGITGAVKFDSGGASYSFTSNRSPVWRDFCIKDGSTGATDDNSAGGNPDCGTVTTDATLLAWNSGLTNHSSDNINHFIAAPNGAPIPEPSTLLLSGLGLAGVYGYIRRRRLMNNF